ncbi:MAG: class I SAM-dependent RNA methyltransferase [Clostridium sp.]|jgi:putative N6-adenine-specific DNA methylase|nr:class I SAM-dependent RNA methyltransferase [Clostridium sp.]
MNKAEYIAPCHFGMEAVLKREIIKLGYEVTQVIDGRVSFLGDSAAICRSNLFLRTAERILLKIGEFEAHSWEDLFQGMKAIAWEDYLPLNAQFWVTKAASVKSQLFAPSTIQKISKKAMVDRMSQAYGVMHFAEDGDPYPMRVFVLKDVVTIALDTSGDSLHKRGYRRNAAPAPISENLASSIIQLTPWRADRPFVDPFCGSGTFPIEAAMLACHIAPGSMRDFTAMLWDHLVSTKAWDDARAEARDLEDMRVETDIQGYDMDENAIKIARENAKIAGVGDKIHFQRRSMEDLSHHRKYGFIITNPPYGERMNLANLQEIYQHLGERYRKLDSWSMFLISGYEDAQKDIGRPADKNRKLYNGMLKTYLYQYFGPKPGR